MSTHLSNIPRNELREIVMQQITPPASDPAMQRAKNFLQNDLIESPVYPTIVFGGGVDPWEQSVSRSHGRYLHGLIFLRDWITTVLVDDSIADLAAERALSVVTSWVDCNAHDSASEMAYHDETTAQRLITLLALKPALEKLSPSASDVLVPLMRSTSRLLADPAFHSPGNNHGMFQDFALLYYAILMEEQYDALLGDLLELAFERLHQYFTTCFTSDGVHTENTPTYHLMIARQLAVADKIAQTAGHGSAHSYSKLRKAAEAYATHALTPDGTFPPISDTDRKKIRQSDIDQVFTSSEFAFAATRGLRGTAPADRILVLPESGYAIYRSAWGDPSASYLFFSAAYNADYHKHSDDLSFFLQSGGMDLLCEAGPFGYDYENPLTKYAYSQFAHNTLIVDGKSTPRTDVSREKVRLELISQSDTELVVEGTNERNSQAIHKRRIFLDEADRIPFIRIEDFTEADESHDYQLLWHVAPGLRVSTNAEGFELFSGTRKVMDLAFASSAALRVSQVRGETKPRPMGWRFPKMGVAEPSDVVIASFSGSSVSVATQIRLKDFIFKEYDITAHARSIHLSVDCSADTLHAYKLYQGRQLERTLGYSKERSVQFEDLQPGRYRVRIYSKRSADREPTAFTTKWVEIVRD
ncbi:alginate lyase family protein [uncultured Arthrobacter sp.]|uniref:heparinase II/III family protein n=1 Tax=uncultured Arthrobacter sp. TaxID=114050 RepID=UPI0026284EAB|nr:alginate lyase family protein [uncultured Arthrobacter sp.]